VKDIAAFAQTFPKIALAINFTDVQQDLIREGIDLAIRIGDLKSSALKAKRLFDMKRKLIVAPNYIINRKHPLKPRDIADWDWIGLKMRPNHKTLINKAGKTVEINFQPRIIVDSVEAVCQLAIAGLGLATPPAFLVEEELRQGLLIEPLPAWGVEALGVYAVWPPNASKESLTFRLINFLETREKAR
jgi:DNA-binding transcriptional LysR family regulator